MEYFYEQLYDANGHQDGVVYYYRIINSHSSYIWDNVAKEMAELPTWEDSIVDLTERGTTGQYPIVIPDGLPGGVYDIVVYQQSGSVPANTDDLVKQIAGVKHGSIFGF